MISRRFKIAFWVVAAALFAAVVGNDSAFAQYVQSKLAPPPPAPVQAPQQPERKNRSVRDTLSLPFTVRPTVPGNYDDVSGNGEYSLDLKNPANITTEAEYDPESGCYVIHTKLGENDIVTPFILSADEYNNIALRQSMQEYYRQKNAESAEEKAKNPFNFLDMQFGLGPLESIFGPGGVQLKTQGSIVVNMGVKSNKTDNPAMSVQSRRKTYFDFDQKIQATISASVGDKMKFNMTYNTDATFEFDNKNLKLAYDGKEDEIIKNIEAGNVSMTTGSSLIRGSAALFGVKTKLQFGKLTATALVSQQNSESQTVNTKGGAQTTKFYITGDKYDQNRNFFLSHFFRDNYDSWCSKLPLVSSGINVTRVEVWITNKRSNFSEARNLIAFEDVGENKRISNSHWVPNVGEDNPSNSSNNLLSEIKTQYPEARDIRQVATALVPLKAYGFEGGKDYEKIESARLLSSSEYTLNSTLGYIQLKTALNSDEVLAVAYQYTYYGSTYQVGEFSGDITETDQSLYVKMLKGTTTLTTQPMWDLMMKNIYSLGAYQVQKQNFKLNIKYLSDTTGTELPYIPAGVINGVPLLQVMNLDRLDANQEYNKDGRFDYIENYTVNSSLGKVIFPVVEPFGDHLRKKLNNESLAKVYVYDELYDTTLTAARQIQDKNKFVLEGEYQASSGNVIKLNAMNVPRGSVVVTAGGVVLTENSDYTVDYNMGTVTITNQSIIDAGTNISVSLESQSTFSMQRKTLMGLDLDYAFNKNFHIGGTIMHYGEKALTEKVAIGDEIVNNTIWGVNMNYNTKFMWLTNLLNKIPTVNATVPSSITFKGEFAQLLPHQAKTGSNAGSSYIDDFESTQSGIDLRSPYSWFLASTPYDNSANALFPEASLSNNIDYGKNRSLLSWYYIDRLFTQRNSSYAPGYIKIDTEQLSNPYVREVSYSEVFPGRDLNYGESSTIQTLNLSFYPKERGPYNLDATNIDSEGNLLNPEKRWGGIMRKLDNTNFEQSNIEYIQFWLLDPFMDEKNPNRDGGYLYLNLGEVSEDILKDGLKSYENGLPIDGDSTYVKTTNWGKVSTQTSMTYAFDTDSEARPKQDVGLNGLSTAEEKEFPTYKEYTDKLRQTLPATTIKKMEDDMFSPLNDPAGDNYHFYRGYDYDGMRLSILDRYKHYNGTEGNSLSQDDVTDKLYQSSRSVPDVEDINQDNTLNEYERYFQYRVAIHPDSLQVGMNHITDKQVAKVRTRDGKDQTATWYQFSIPLREYEKKVGTISDFSTIRFMRMFMTGFRETTHLRFATLELVRGEWRNYDYNLNLRGETPATGTININSVNIEENASREPVNYVLPPGVSRIVDSGQSQITQLNEQSMQMKVQGLQADDARGVYRNTSLDLRIYQRLQMFLHGESLIDDATNLKNGDVSVFLRLGTDIKNNYYEYEVPLELTPHGRYNTNSSQDRLKVWPENNTMDIDLDVFTEVKKHRNAEKLSGSSEVSYFQRYQEQDPDHPNHRVFVMGNPTLSDVRVLMIGVRNNAPTSKDCIVWVDEMRVTDFDNNGGWAAKANATLNMSDIATVNVGFHKETYGFGAVNESLSQRRMDNYNQYNVAVQGDAGRFLPEKAKLHAPIYYSFSNETTIPEYNPLDQDVLLKDALDACENQHQRDSINNFAETKRTVKSFSVSGLKFDVKSKNPMPWDPANFTFSYSSNKQHLNDPDNVYENTNDYRGSMQYSWTPFIKPFSPLKKAIDAKNKNLKFFREWEFRWLPTNISFGTNISRYYYEQQTRNETGIDVELPVAVSKNFLWDRQFAITWNFTKSLSVSFNSNTTAHILEPIGQVNKELFPDQYRDWRDSVWRSIKDLGTPWAYNQTFTASYKAPFSAVPILSFITASATYNSTYRWDRGTVVDNVSSGNTVANQSSLNIDFRMSMDQFYNKIPYLQAVNKRFSSSANKNTVGPKKTTKAKKFQRTFKLHSDSDSVLVIKHNLNVKKVKVSATTTDNKPFAVNFKVRDNNNVEILTTGDKTIKFVVTEDLSVNKSFWSELAQYTTRALMSVKSVNVRWRNTNSLSLPQFIPDVGDIFGQNTHYDVMAPGLDFAFGFVGESYVEKAKSRGWLLGDQSMTTPAIFSKTQEFNAEVQLEPVKGLKVTLTGNRTDNRTSQMQFMYDDMGMLYAGSYTKTHMAIATAFAGRGNSDNGYHSGVFDEFLANIPIVAQRMQDQYIGTTYPNRGFIKGNVAAGQEFDPSFGSVNQMSSDVLIPAFMAAYSGKDARKVTLSPFPSLKEILPNWRVTYDGLAKLPFFSKYFKTFTLTHAYQCTYQVGSFNSFTDWVDIGSGLGFTQDALTGSIVPSSPYNISSITVTEKFAPLIGVNMTLNNNMTLNCEYRDQRTLSLNSSAGQVVEANTTSFVIGAGYKIANFNTVLKMKGGKQQGVSNDLTLNFDLQFNNNNALIRKIVDNTAQATSGTRTFSIKFTANYQVSKRITMGAYFDHQMNTPLVSTTAYPTTNTNYGLSFNMSLVK